MNNEMRHGKFWKKLICCFLFCALLIGCANSNIEPTSSPDIIPSPTPTAEPTEDEKLNEQVKTTLDAMTIDEKIGQVFVISYRSPVFDSKIKATMEEVQPGGFILFQENITSYQQATEYIQAMKSTAKIPILIGIDQEGGNVQRIRKLPDANVLTIPYMYYLGQTKNQDLSYQVGKVVGEELKAFGINLNYAPSIDIFSNPNNTVIGKRAFGTDAKTVIDMAFPFTKGLRDSGIIPVVKHFPGHGDTVVDSHVGLPIVTKTKEELWERELLPFQEAIKEGVDMIMVAHIALPQLTGDDTPSSLSHTIITDLLRGEMGYDGVITTDAIDMRALSDRYSTKEICTKAIQAGVDQILMPLESRDAVVAMKESLEEGQITVEQIDLAVSRILKMKYKNHLTNDQEDLNPSVIGSKEHQSIMNQILQ